MDTGTLLFGAAAEGFDAIYFRQFKHDTSLKFWSLRNHRVFLVQMAFIR